MGKIKQLDVQLSNKIAAGEVVERPASVVKELVENAIDASSTKIEVHVKEAGLSEIRVIDNGVGMEGEDCLLAFERHATSKIKDEHDLFRIRTLGFRGEALPSIVSVSEVEMKTSTGKGPGTWIKMKGGQLLEQASTASRKGTEIIVRNLFFNTPARLKYMKSIHTELGNITDYMNRIAMAHPDISFLLTHNGKRILFTSGNGDLLQVIASIYGLSIAKQMVPIQVENIDFQVQGFLSKPEVTRASRNYISIIMNGRYIKNYVLAKAVLEGYHTLLPIGRFPIVLLSIVMDPILVDVNVHPSKLEVRLSKEKELSALIQEGIQMTFRKETLIPEVSKPTKTLKQESEQQSLSFEHTITRESAAAQNTNILLEQPAMLFKEEPETELTKNLGEEGKAKEPPSEEQQPAPPMKETTSTSMTKKEEVPIKTNEESRVPPLYPIGQMHGTYILAENEKGLYIIDQHAAQERIKYEYYKEKVGEVPREVQEMLLPITLEYSKDEALIIEEHLELLRNVGVFIEPFGSGSFIVRSHPTWFPKGEEKQIIEQIIHQVLTKKKISIHELREEAAIMMSCKGSIKANQHLRKDEMFSLLETLRKTTDPFTCPHGRPIIIHFSTYEMEKMFKRVM